MTDRHQIITELQTERDAAVLAVQTTRAELERAAYDGLINGNYGTGEATLEHKLGALRAQEGRVELYDLALAGAARA
jgi:hypothetical protein